MNSTLSRIGTDNSVLLVVDLQQKLLPAMTDAAGCVAASIRLISAARVLDVPMVVTEQYPAGLGRTCEEVAAALPEGPAIEKTRFSACVEPVLSRLKGLGRPNVLVVGIEAHVCVQQTVLDLLRNGYGAFVCADAVSSRRALDRDTALARMRHAGAVITTTESAIFEMLGEAGTAAFKQVLKIVK